MTAFVLDNSVAMRWCFKTSANTYADGILKQLLTGDRAVVPLLWLYEVSAVLARGQKDFSLTAVDASDFITDLNQLPITVDPLSAEYVLTDVYRLAVAHRLTGYDAAYLELAMRRNRPLATLDNDLIRTCKNLRPSIAVKSARVGTIGFKTRTSPPTAATASGCPGT